MSNVYGTPYWLIHRPDYHHLLHQAALDNGCEIRVKSRVTTVDESVPSLTLVSGETLKADIIIGADGIRHFSYTNRKESNPLYDSRLSITRCNHAYTVNVRIVRPYLLKISFLIPN
jgi:2-polyprenyl-6-methoxyphenol hydroxylase-like FAD-dependent oxidoreductase